MKINNNRVNNRCKGKRNTEDETLINYITVYILYRARVAKKNNRKILQTTKNDEIVII